MYYIQYTASSKNTGQVPVAPKLVTSITALNIVEVTDPIIIKAKYLRQF